MDSSQNDIASVYSNLVLCVENLNWNSPDVNKSKTTRNHIFVFSSCSGVAEVFTTPLLSHLRGKGISVNWIYNTDLQQSSALSQALQTTGGSLIPISTFLAPASYPSHDDGDEFPPFTPAVLSPLFPYYQPFGVKSSTFKHFQK